MIIDEVTYEIILALRIGQDFSTGTLLFNRGNIGFDSFFILFFDICQVGGLQFIISLISIENHIKIIWRKNMGLNLIRFSLNLNQSNFH